VLRLKAAIRSCSGAVARRRRRWRKPGCRPHRARHHRRIGGLAYAGIRPPIATPNHAVTFITGHGADGKLPKLKLAALAQGSPTLVLYMARKYAARSHRR